MTRLERTTNDAGADAVTGPVDLGIGAIDPAADGPDEGELVIDHVSHRYSARSGSVVEVLNDLSLSVAPGSVTCLVGPSGCGKSTLLSIVAGLQAASEGTVLWDGRPITPGPNHEMAMAFQQPALFPWMTVERNVAIGLETRGQSRADARRATEEILSAVGLIDSRSAYPSQLSGGMAQRVGIARAFALKPRLLLLDEPFAAVDALTRLTLQTEFKTLLQLGRPTVLFVTHDVGEAITVGDQVVVMTRRPAAVKQIVPIDIDRKSVV